MKNKKESLRLKRHNRIKLRLRGTTERPRLVVRRTLKNFYAQLIDDAQQKIIISISTLAKELKNKFKQAGSVKASEFFGEELGRKIKEKGINRIVFDRAGYLYHGIIKAFAEALRKQGLEF